MTAWDITKEVVQFGANLAVMSVGVLALVYFAFVLISGGGFGAKEARSRHEGWVGVFRGVVRGSVRPVVDVVIRREGEIPEGAPDPEEAKEGVNLLAMKDMASRKQAEGQSIGEGNTDVSTGYRQNTEGAGGQPTSERGASDPVEYCMTGERGRQGPTINSFIE